MFNPSTSYALLEKAAQYRDAAPPDKRGAVD